MTEQSVPAPPPPPAGPPETRKWYEKKRFLLPIVAFAGFFIGLGVSGNGEPAAESGSGETVVLEERNAELEAQVVELEEEAGAAGEVEPEDDGEGREDLAAAEGDLEAREAALAEGEAALVEREAALAEAEADAAPTSEPTGEPTEPAPPAGDLRSATYAAGQFSLTDVQVREDFAGDFEIVARATNTGDAIEGAILTATVFSGGQVVGTLQGSVPAAEGGQTVTVEFFSTDTFAEHDAIEFQVDAAF